MLDMGAQTCNLLLIETARRCPNICTIMPSGILLRHALYTLGQCLHKLLEIDFNYVSQQLANPSSGEIDPSDSAKCFLDRLPFGCDAKLRKQIKRRKKRNSECRNRFKL